MTQPSKYTTALDNYNQAIQAVKLAQNAVDANAESSCYISDGQMLDTLYDIIRDQKPQTIEQKAFTYDIMQEALRIGYSMGEM
jgi:hypothetical protein